jgi:hypothetical protein
MSLIGAVAYLVFCLCSCAGGQWKTVAVVRSAGVAVDTSITAVVRARHLDCTKHGSTVAYNTCIAPHRSALHSWTNYAKPALNSALIVTVASLQAAEAQKTKVDVWALLKPGLCALASGLAEWGHLLPPAVMTAAKAVAASVVCEAK